MGLFDKKYCDVCGEKIGLLGNRKLEDGNLCKHCAAKLSPFFTGRRHTDLETIKEHLDYREANQEEVAEMHPSVVIGSRTKVYIDENRKKFFVTSSNKWKEANPDVIKLSQVSGVYTEVQEHKTEIYDKDDAGKQISFNPKRYEISYEFTTVIHVDCEWFSEIKFELSGHRPDSRYTDQYRELEKMADDLKNILMSDKNESDNSSPAIKDGEWECDYCGMVNSGKFCEACGAPRQLG